MTHSAITANRQRTLTQIVRCAQDLAEARGLDGFTVEDLAKAAGVSRRTLFNYVDGKLDAVLGAPPPPDPARLDEFRAGGPTGDLADDLKMVIGRALDRKDSEPAQLATLQRLIASDARLHKALHDKFAIVVGFIADAILERDDRFDRPRAHAAATVTLSLFDLALESYVADPSTSLSDHFMAAFAGLEALFD